MRMIRCFPWICPVVVVLLLAADGSNGLLLAPTLATIRTHRPAAANGGTNILRMSSPPSSSSSSEKERVKEKSKPKPKFQENDDPEFLSQRTFGGYTVKQRLREEVESPFRKVRLLFFGSSVASALTALYFSMLSTIKAFANQNGAGGGDIRYPDAPPLDEALTSDAINVVAAVVCAALCYREYRAGQANLKRIAQGGQLASLVVETVHDSQRLALASYRRIARVVLAIGGHDYLRALAGSLARSPGTAAKLAESDLVVVPVLLVTNDERAPTSVSDIRVAGDTGDVWKAMLGKAGVDIDAVPDDGIDDVPLSRVLAIPRGASVWTEYLAKHELDTAMSAQNIDVMSKGIHVIVKKNGKILRRATGLPPWSSMIGFMEVADGSRFGMPGDSEKYGGA